MKELRKTIEKIINKSRIKFLLCGLLSVIVILSGCASGNEKDTIEAMSSDENTQMEEEEQKELPDMAETEPEVIDNQDTVEPEVVDNQDTTEPETSDNQELYVPDLSGLSDEVIEQLEAFAKNKDVWNIKYTPRAFYYAVFDLDNDGSLELITSAIAGTGQYSENHFYHINDTFTEIEELPQEYSGKLIEADSELDIALLDYEYAYKDGKATYYPASDFIRDGFQWLASVDGAYYLQNGTVYIVIYRSVYTLCDGDGEDTWYDASGNEITKEAWEKQGEDFYAGMETIAYPICWEYKSPTEIGQDSNQKLFSELIENYKAGLGQ